MQLRFLRGDCAVRHVVNDFVYLRECPLHRLEHLQGVFVDDVRRPRDLPVRIFMDVAIVEPAGVREKRERKRDCRDEGHLQESDGVALCSVHCGRRVGVHSRAASEFMQNRNIPHFPDGTRYENLSSVMACVTILRARRDGTALTPTKRPACSAGAGREIGMRGSEHDSHESCRVGDDLRREHPKCAISWSPPQANIGNTG